MFDLDDHIVVKLAVERMKNVVGGARAIVFRIAPIEVMVIDKCAIKNDSAMRHKGARDHIGGIGRRAVIRRWTEAALRIRLDDNAGKIGNQPVNFFDFLSPPFGHARIRGIERVEASDYFRTADVDGDR